VLSKEKPVSILSEKPYFELSIQVKNVEAHVLVNGIDVFSEVDGNFVSTEIPINHWLSPRDNDFRVMFRSLNEDGKYGDSAKVDVQLQVSNDGSGARYPICNLIFNAQILQPGFELDTIMPAVSLVSSSAFKPGGGGDVIIDEAVLEQEEDFSEFSSIGRKVKMQINIPEWEFFNSDTVPDVNELSDADYEKYRNELLKEYLKIQNAIATKNIASIVNMFDERNKELDAAFFYKPGTMKKKIFEALTDAANDADAELLELLPEYVGFYSYMTPKLIKLIREDGGAAIAQNFKKAMGSQSFDLIFRYKNGKWILTR